MPFEDVLRTLVDSSALPREPRHARERLNRLRQLDTTFTELSSGLVHLPALLEGTRWTVWVDPEDAANGLVRMHPHLSPLGWWLIGDEVALLDAAGRTIGWVETDGRWLDGSDVDVVLGPPGWLEELAGGWATVEVTGAGLRWTPCAAVPEPTEAQRAAIRLGFERSAETEVLPAVVEEHDAIELRMAWGDRPVHEALLADRDAFTQAPVPPLSVLYGAAGLEVRRGVAAAEGFDWDALGRWQRRNRLRSVHDLDDQLVDGLLVSLGALRLVLEEGAAALGDDDAERLGGAALLAALLEPDRVTEAFWEEATAEGVSPAEIDGYVEVLATHLDERLPVGLAWLRARALEADGEAATAVGVLEAAVTGTCTHSPALVELAGYRADQGDAGAALRLLRRAGVVHEDDDESLVPMGEAHRLLHEVEGLAMHRPPLVARRNDPCPCGSGRKYKLCHLGRERHDLSVRAGWLYDKAIRFAHRHGDALVEDLVDTLASGDPALAFRLQDLPTVMDLSLHEGELFDAFLASRGALLPDDEALLAAQWSLVDRGLFEIERVQGDRLELLDIGRSERITVVNTHPSERTRPGVLLIGRPLPVGDTHRAFAGFLQVSGTSVPALLDAIDSDDPFAVAEELAVLFRPPHVENTDGEAMVFHTVRWQVPDPAAVGPALQAAGWLGEDEPVWRLVRPSGSRGQTEIATLRLEDDLLVGEANSDERADVVRSVVAARIPGAAEVSRESRSLRDAMDLLERSAAPPATEPGQMSAERLRAALGLDS
jgi:hypothetical protein